MIKELSPMDKVLLTAKRRALRELDEPIKSDKWKNLYFSKTGISLLGHDIFPTAEEANKVGMTYIKENTGCKVTLEGANGKTFHIRDFSHLIQIPIK